MPAAESADADLLLKLDRQLCFAIYAASLAMTRFYQPLLEPLGLTYPQYLVMLALWESDGATVSQLGARLNLDSGTLSPLLKRLEGAGWVTRTRAADDERRVRVHLSEAGQALKARIRHVPLCAFEAAGGSPAEVQQLTTALHALRARTAAATPFHPPPSKEITP